MLIKEDTHFFFANFILDPFKFSYESFNFFSE